jgi:hypothetical protein
LCSKTTAIEPTNSDTGGHPAATGGSRSVAVNPPVSAGDQQQQAHHQFCARPHHHHEQLSPAASITAEVFIITFLNFHLKHKITSIWQSIIPKLLPGATG